MKTLIVDYPSLDLKFEKLSLSRPSGTYGIVNPDYEQVWEGYKVNKKASRPTRNGISYFAVSGKGLPATARFADDKFVNFTKDIQFWLHNICSEKIPNETEDYKKKSFKSHFRDNAYITNFSGTNTRADYINENNMPPYIQIQPMVTGGSLVKIIGEYRKDYWMIESINPEDDYKTYHPDFHKWLFFRPTISVRNWLFDGKGNVVSKEEWYNEPFDDYRENTIIPIFGFINVGKNKSSTGYANIISKSRVRVLENEAPIPNPFILRNGRTIPNPYSGF